MIVRPWEPGDTEKLVLQPGQQYLAETIKNLDLQPMADQGMTWTVEDEDGVHGIGGIWPQWENRAIAWSLIGCDLGKHFVAVHRVVKRTLVRAPFRRIEATVDVGFTQGHRWMQMLGFEMEGYMKAYLPNGRDQVLYARVRR